MKNNKGFTLVELIAVVVILGLVAGIATVGYTGYRAKVNEREKSILRQNIMSAFNNYRVRNTTDKEEVLEISSFNFSSKLAYDGKKCEDISGTIKYVIKKDHDISDSLEEVYCISFICNQVLAIDDYASNPTYCNN